MGSTWRSRNAAAVVILLLALTLAACIPPPTPAVPPLAQNIVGHWVNAQGGAIDFYADGTGYIPPYVENNLPAYTFTFTIPDETHVAIKLSGEAKEVTVGVKIEGDKLTWTNPSTGAETVYTRGK